MKKIIFITGSEGQIGQRMTEFFFKKGWICFGMDIRPQTSSKYLEKYLQGDVKSRDCFKEFFRLVHLKENFEYEVSLINNAGLAVFTPSEDRTYEEFRQVCEVNLLGPINGITEFFKYFSLKKKEILFKNLNIINISSIYGIIAPNQKIYTDTKRNSSEIYGATKAGLIQLTKYFATRYAKNNIQVNAIAPGGVLNEKHQGPEFIRNYSELVPKKRLCSDLELVNLIYSILESNCTYLTGQTISIDGGMSSW